MTGQGYVIGLSLLLDGEVVLGVMGRWTEARHAVPILAGCVFNSGNPNAALLQSNSGIDDETKKDHGCSLGYSQNTSKELQIAAEAGVASPRQWTHRPSCSLWLGCCSATPKHYLAVLGCPALLSGERRGSALVACQGPWPAELRTPKTKVGNARSATAQHFQVTLGPACQTSRRFPRPRPRTCKKAASKHCVRGVRIKCSVGLCGKTKVVTTLRGCCLRRALGMPAGPRLALPWLP